MSLMVEGYFEFIRMQTILTHFNVAATTFALWDWCLTMDREIALVWRAKLNAVSVLFLFNRYLALLIMIAMIIFIPEVHRNFSPGVIACKTYTWIQAILSYGVYHCIEILMMLRLFAFYERKTQVLRWLSIMFLLKQAIVLPVYMRSIASLKVVQAPSESQLYYGTCLVLDTPTMFVVYWAMNIIVMATLFLLLIIKFFTIKRETGMAIPHLLKVFVRDGAWAVGITLLMLLFCALTLELSPDRGNVAFTFLYAGLSSLGSRLILNLRLEVQAHIWSATNVDQIDLVCPTLTKSGYGIDIPNPSVVEEECSTGDVS